MSAGTRPVAVLDGLRFGDISRDSHAAWLLGGAVRGNIRLRQLHGHTHNRRRGRL